VWDAFKQAAQADDASAPDWRLVGQHGTTLRALRNQTEYDDRVNQLPGRLQAALVTAELALKTLPALQTR
jgi:hypothetical protein